MSKTWNPAGTAVIRTDDGKRGAPPQQTLPEHGQASKPVEKEHQQVAQPPR